jgi:hypothetical protein
MKFNYNRTEFYENEMEILFPLPELDELEWTTWDVGYDYFILSCDEPEAIRWARGLGATNVTTDNSPTIRLGEYEWNVVIHEAMGKAFCLLELLDANCVSEGASLYDIEVSYEVR